MPPRLDDRHRDALVHSTAKNRGGRRTSGVVARQTDLAAMQPAAAEREARNRTSVSAGRGRGPGSVCSFTSSITSSTSRCCGIGRIPQVDADRDRQPGHRRGA